MAHEIDFSIGRPAIAYAGDAPWHRLGTRLAPDAPIDTWIEAAGLGWHANEAPVQYIDRDGNLAAFPGMKVLSRSDTGAPLSVVSDGYKTVQPADVMAFFADLIKTGGFTMECAGVLMGGKRIWALARVNDGAPIVAGDTVMPYVMLGTGYDGTYATTGRLTGIRVVCKNTLDLSEWSQAGTTVRVTHDQQFNASRARMDLGIYADGFERWMIDARRMAAREMKAPLADMLTADLFSTILPASSPEAIRESAGYLRVMELFKGAAVGSDMAGPTVWGWLNATTQYVDHERGRLGDERRFLSSMMGAGNRLKNVAQAKALELI